MLQFINEHDAALHLWASELGIAIHSRSASEMTMKCSTAKGT